MKRVNRRNDLNIDVGDILEFTNDVGYKVSKTVIRVTDKSCFSPGRESWGTILDYAKYPDFKIIRAS